MLHQAFFASEMVIASAGGLNPGPLTDKSSTLPMKFKGKTREIFSQANES